jgi:hypothetical protein
MVNAWIIGLFGIWMVIAPFFSMSLSWNAWNDGIVGIIVAVLGFSMASDHVWQRVLAGIVGLWLLVSGFVPALRLGQGLTTNDLIAGILLVIAGVTATRHHQQVMAPPHAAR